MAVYTRLDGVRYFANLAIEGGKNKITIFNKKYRTEVFSICVEHSAQKEAMALLRHYDEKEPFEND